MHELSAYESSLRRYPFYKPMIFKSERGLGLVELVIGLAGMAAISAVVAALFGAGMKSFTHTLRVSSAMNSARQAMEGGSSLAGMSWQLRDALWINDLSASSLTVTTSNSTVVSYSLSDNTFWNTTQGIQKQQAKNITSVQTQYYNIGDSGLIIQSTSAVSATFATTWVQVEGRGKNAKTYTFFSGARLRNHP
jgi:hypothetical protein